MLPPRAVPELHDLGKLVDNEQIERALNIKLESHYLRPTVGWQAGQLQQLIGVPEPQTDTWKLIQYHGQAPYTDLASSPLKGRARLDALLASVADRMASSASRAIRVGLADQTYHHVHKLWHPTAQPSANETWAAIATLSQFRDVIEFLNQNPDADAFRQRFGAWLEAIPEDKEPPNVVTTLGTHIRLVSQIYRLLLRHTAPIPSEDDVQYVAFAGSPPVATVREACHMWRFKLVQCRLRFPQMPVRARDLNIYGILESLNRELVSSAHRDYLLFSTTDTMWLLVPGDESVPMSTIMHKYLEWGLYAEMHSVTFVPESFYPDPVDWVEAYRLRVRQLSDMLQRLQKGIVDDETRLVRMRQDLSSAQGTARAQLGPQIGKMDASVRARQAQARQLQNAINAWQATHTEVTQQLTTQSASLYHERISHSTELPGSVICDLCQQQEAAEVGEENICKTCASVRKERLACPNLAQWEDEQPNSLVAWVKLSLDYARAAETIRRLFGHFVDDVLRGSQRATEHGEKARLEFRPVAVLADFTDDYKALTAAFARRLLGSSDESGLFDQRDTEAIATEVKDFYVIRVAGAARVGDIADCFALLLRERFGQCIDGSPIRLAVTVGPIKFPFFEHWQYLNREQSQVVNIWQRAQTPLEVTIQQWQELRKINLREIQIVSFLHNLARIEAISQSRLLTEVALLDAPPAALPVANLFRQHGLRVDQILAYYKLMRS